MEALRTPLERFTNLPDFPFDPCYANVGNDLQMHYLDEGPANGRMILLLHGEPSWCYLYRYMIPPLVEAGFRCIAPDLIGFGKSDKPIRKSDYSYQAHLNWIKSLLDQLGLNNIRLFGQDWGGLIGLRIAAEAPDRFSHVVASNTFLPTGATKISDVFLQWRAFSQTSPVFDIGQVIQMGTHQELPEEILNAYRAPFPNESYKAGARIFPALVPIEKKDPEAVKNREALAVFSKWDKPFLTLFGAYDTITRGADQMLQKIIPGALGQPHDILEAGHFIQEEQGPELARRLINWWS